MSALAAACGGTPTPAPAPAPTPSVPASASPQIAPEPDAPAADGGDPMVGLDGMMLPRVVDPLDVMAEPLAGPFESPDAYVAKVQADREEGCQPNTAKPTVKTKSLVGRDDIEELMLFRAPTGDTCERTEHCFMSIRTDAGWWIGQRQCTGPIDGDRVMSTSDTTLRWAEKIGAPGPLALVEYTVTVTHAKTKKTLEELRWMRLCGLGSKKRARCTRPVLTGCLEDDGTRSASTIKIRQGGVTLTSSAKAGEACDGHEAFLVGDFDVTFP